MFTFYKSIGELQMMQEEHALLTAITILSPGELPPGHVAQVKKSWSNQQKSTWKVIGLFLNVSNAPYHSFLASDG